MRSNRVAFASWSVSYQRYAQFGVVLENLREVTVGKKCTPCGVYITRLNDRDWWTFQSQEELDTYIFSHRIEIVETVKSLSELKALIKKKKVEAEKLEEQRKKQGELSQRKFNVKRRIENLSLEDVKSERNENVRRICPLNKLSEHRKENLTNKNGIENGSWWRTCQERYVYAMDVEKFAHSS